MKRCPYCFTLLADHEHCSCHYQECSNAHITAALPPGTVIGGVYVIGAVLGQGGFGITYKGFDTKQERIVAIKEFFPKEMVSRTQYQDINAELRFSASVSLLSQVKSGIYEKARKMFLREISILSKLNHFENIVHIHEIFQENSTVYYVMDYINGKSLKQIQDDKGKISEDELIALLDPVLQTLGEIHREGLLHRDIAPDNILIDENGRPILVDFGSATDETGRLFALSDSGSDPPLNSSSLIVEKKGYTPLEQLGGMATERSDIYALGATFYHLLSGFVPPTAYQRCSDRKKDPAVPLTHFGVSGPVSKAVMKAMAFDEDDRWKSVGEFRSALLKATQKKKKTVKLALAGITLILTAGFLFLFSYRHPGFIPFPFTDTRTAVPLPTNTSGAVTADMRNLPNSPTAAVFDTPIPTDTPTEPSPAAEVPSVSYEWNYAFFTPGDKKYYGHYGEKPISWIVLSVDEIYKRALLLSEFALEEAKYNETPDHTNWEHSDIRTRLNGTFLDEHFTPEEISRIQTVHRHITSGSITAAAGYQISESDDRIFLLTFPELQKYIYPDLILDSPRCMLADWPVYVRYWLADNLSDGGVRVIRNDGMDDSCPADADSVFVRPALWLKY